jgi:RimJ/RimL family protein N-acetyltransferase
VAIPTIETERLRLRAFLDADREPFAELNADADVMEFMPKALSREESDRFIDLTIQRWAERGYGQWALERRHDGAFLGFTGLSAPGFEAHFTPAVEVGWRLAREAWGHGYATEAGAAALAYGFETLQLEEIVSFTTVANERSRRVMERLGMTRDPTDDFSHPGLAPGDPIRPHVLYRLSRYAWAARIQRA